jgi:hypothetical protein
VEPAPTVAEFQATIEDAFAVWEAQDPETGLGTDLYFVPDFETPIVIEPVPPNLQGFFKLNRGAEIDLTSWNFSGNTTLGEAWSFGDPNSDSVTLTSGVPDYSAAVFSGADIRMRRTNLAPPFPTEVPWNLTNFKLVLAHEIGHVLSLMHPNASTGGGFRSAFYDDNYDGTSHATALETLTNSFADLIDPLDPDNSPALTQFALCNNPQAGENCVSSPGVDSPGVDLLMDAVGQGVGLQNDEYAGRQFLYPYVRVPGDFNADKILTVEDVDLLLAEIGEPAPRSWFDLTGDELVDFDDRDAWAELHGTFVGDANLDGQVNAADLNALALSWRADDATSWEQGDFNGDGFINATDLNDLALNWQSGTVQASAAPEPSGGSLLVIAGLGMLMLARYRAGFAKKPK